MTMALQAIYLGPNPSRRIISLRHLINISNNNLFKCALPNISGGLKLVLTGYFEILYSEQQYRWEAAYAKRLINGLGLEGRFLTDKEIEADRTAAWLAWRRNSPRYHSPVFRLNSGDLLQIGSLHIFFRDKPFAEIYFDYVLPEERNQASSLAKEKGYTVGDMERKLLIRGDIAHNIDYDVRNTPKESWPEQWTARRDERLKTLGDFIRAVEGK